MERALSAGISREETDLITTICAICLKTCRSSPGCEGSAECQEGGHGRGPRRLQAASAGIPGENRRQQNSTVHDGFQSKNTDLGEVLLHPPS